jgi:late competence protein required for DNA uptake (superfamily II DNA/RNA helicase)
MVIYDMKERTISGTKVTCHSCNKSLSSGEDAYFASTNKKVFCKACLCEGTVMSEEAKVGSSWDKTNSVYYWGKVQITPEAKAL